MHSRGLGRTLQCFIALITKQVLGALTLVRHHWVSKLVISESDVLVLFYCCCCLFALAFTYWGRLVHALLPSEFRGQHAVVSSLFLTCESWGSNTAHQAWWQAHLSAALSHWLCFCLRPVAHAGLRLTTVLLLQHFLGAGVTGMSCHLQLQCSF